MKILLLNPPGDRLYMRANYCTGTAKANAYWQPIDLAIQSGILSTRQDVSVIDAIIERLDEDAVSSRAAEIKPDAVFFITASCSWKTDFDFLKRLKERTGAKMIASGGFLLEMGEKVLQESPFLDAILTDFTSDGLIAYLEGRFDDVRDVIFRGPDSEVISTQDKGNRDEFSYPPPRHDLFPLKRYRLPWAQGSPMATMIASLGCPFSCTFCSNQLRTYRIRSVESVKEELLYLDSIGVNELHFVDYNMIVGKKKATELLSGIISLDKQFSFDCINRVDTLDDDLCRLLKEAGCHAIQLGVESGDDTILEKYAKGMTTDVIREGFRLCKKHSIRTIGFFLIGLPGETEQTINSTIEFAKELDCDFASFATVDPYIGTKLREDAIEAGYITDEDTQFDGGAFTAIATEKLSKEQVWRLRNKAVRSFYFRPSFILKKLRMARRPSTLWGYALDAFTILRNMGGQK
ncbi:MAG: radical SAM protein [Candidatus Coatesbacteria bacterium]|nr:radical SAM protein [Candidatus Coatesbacteria bacterium]